MPYSVSLGEISRRGLLVAVVHSAVVGIPVTLFFLNTPTMTLDYFVILVVIATVPLYIATGIPNVIRDNCRKCGELMNLGKAYCDNCGDKLQSNPAEQMLWFLLGYSILTASFGIVFIAYIIDLITDPEMLPVGLGGPVIFIIIFLFMVIYPLSLFIMYQISSHIYVFTKENIFRIPED